MSLKKLRRNIDGIDKKIIQLLNRRVDIASAVAKIKRSQGKCVYSPDREREVLKKVSSINRGPLTTSALEAIYTEIMSFNLAKDRPLKIAYLGPEATFTHQASLKRFGSQVEYNACNTIRDVFSEVERDNCDYGVVPIENSSEGAVSHTLDMFVDSDLKICAQVVLEISHNLLSRSSKNKIKRIYSNPQALSQCQIWLRKNFPLAEKVEVSSTTRAAQIAAGQKASACIASLLAAEFYKLKIIARGIEDSHHNMTRFLVISKNDVNPTKSDRTSVMFSIKDRPGALYDMLSPFKKRAINLTKIESRPSKKKAWDYYFFLDLKGHRLDNNVRNALKELESKCKFLKVLGSYPVGD